MENSLDDKYRTLIAEADSLYNAKDYFLAKEKYEEAGNLKPGETYPRSKIIEIDQLLQKPPTPQKFATVSEGELAITERVNLLYNALEKARTAFYKSGENLLCQVILWSIACGLTAVGWIILGYKLYKFVLPIQWTWQQIVYNVTIKVTLLTAFFSFASFCFKILRSYLHLYQKNNHKKAVIESMASFIEAGNSKEQRDSVLIKLTAMITDYGTTGLIKKEDDLKLSNLTSELVEKILKK